MATVLGGHLATLALDPKREPWPFSQFPMYSSRSAAFPRLRGLRLYVLSGTREIPLIGAEFLAPLEVEHLSVGFSTLVHSHDSSLLRETMRSCATLYEDRRRSGRHSGPPLTELRLYDVRFTPDAQLRNVGQPDQRRLIARYP